MPKEGTLIMLLVFFMYEQIKFYFPLSIKLKQIKGCEKSNGFIHTKKVTISKKLIRTFFAIFFDYIHFGRVITMKLRKELLFPFWGKNL